MSIYARNKLSAQRILDKKGGPVEIRAYLKEPTDPITGESDFSYVKTSPSGICLPSVSAGFKYFDDSFMFDMARGQTKVFIVAAYSCDFIPKAGHRIFWGGKMWDVGTQDQNTGVMPLEVIDGDPILYTIGARLSGFDPLVGFDQVLANVDISFFNNVELI